MCRRDLLTHEFTSPDTWVSNIVLEHELSKLEEQIAAGKSQQNLDHLIDRKMQIEIKMQVMTAMVQSGKLTLDGMLSSILSRSRI